MIDGAHIRAVPSHKSCRLDVTVGKVETAGRPPRRFALAPMGAEQPAQAIRAALIEQGWRPGRPVTVISDGEPALAGIYTLRPIYLAGLDYVSTDVSGFAT